jgi:threonine dehydrogenase-like Zn-dependent dehydrogenase
LDAVVRVEASCVCGSDLWPYRGIEPVDQPHRRGHEWVGTVEQVGANVTTVAPGDFVIAPMYVCDGTCLNCQRNVSVSCLGGGFWGTEIHDKGFADAGQGERVRVPLADGTLVSVPGGKPDPAMLPDLVTLTDVMCTGHHAARAGRVAPGSTVAVIGDGAVGLCAIIAAKRLGAARIVAMSRHESRQKLAVEFGATDVVAERGTAGIEKLKQMFDGVGPDAVLECVGTKESMETAIRAVRPAGNVGYVGAPAGGSTLDMATMYFNNVGVDGGIAFVRDYIPELLPDILNGTIQPGKVFDLELPLAEVADAYQAMDERRAIKVILRSNA